MSLKDITSKVKFNIPLSTISCKPEVGTVITYKYTKLDSNNKPIQPEFMRIRWDAGI